MNIFLNFIFSCFLFLYSILVFANDYSHNLSSINFDESNLTSVQRGAVSFFENCVGCHSIKYVRYKSLAEGIGIVKFGSKEVLNNFIKKNWTFNVVNVNSNVLSTLSANDSVKWFGKIPPDLSLVVKVRGSNWVYTYLKSFYLDFSKPWKINNLIFPDVAMPHNLVDKQGLQELVYEKAGFNVDRLIVTQNGTMSKKGYDDFIYDLVNFLSYISEPSKFERLKFGFVVLPILVMFTIFSYYLKKEIWKGIKKK